MNSNWFVVLLIFLIGCLGGWSANQWLHKAALTEPAVIARGGGSTQSTLPPSVAKVDTRVAKKPEDTTTEMRAYDSAESVVSYLRERSQEPNYDGMGDRTLRNSIHRNPALLKALMNRAVTLEDGPIKRNLVGLLRGVQLVKRARLDDWVIHQLSVGENRSEWLSLLAEIGIQSSHNLSLLITGLPRLTDQTDIRNAIRSMTGPAASKLDLDPTAHTSLVDTIRPFMDSSDAETRAAALQSLQKYASDDMETLLLKGFRDPDSSVRNSARLVFANRMGHSSKLRTHAIDSLEDANLDFSERRSIASLLGSMNLAENEAARVAQFRQRYNLE